LFLGDLLWRCPHGAGGAAHDARGARIRPAIGYNVLAAPGDRGAGDAAGRRHRHVEQFADRHRQLLRLARNRARGHAMTAHDPVAHRAGMGLFAGGLFAPARQFDDLEGAANRILSMMKGQTRHEAGIPVRPDRDDPGGANASAPPAGAITVLPAAATRGGTVTVRWRRPLPGHGDDGGGCCAMRCHAAGPENAVALP
jgi:cbb3-type cytochrome oxidase maturation protein